MLPGDNTRPSVRTFSSSETRGTRGGEEGDMVDTVLERVYEGRDILGGNCMVDRSDV